MAAALLPAGRTQSVLLDEDNMFTSPANYEMHKAFPPVIGLEDGRRMSEQVPEELREMTEQERQWWSSPYLRMLSSPVRQCAVSKKILPSDLLVRLVTLKDTARLSKGSAVLVPDGLLHPRYANRRFGHGNYVACWKDAIDEMEKQHIHKRFISNLQMHALLSSQISHHLRIRVLQELEMLVARLRAAPKSLADHTVVRRLTRSEWQKLKADEVTPWKHASFILVVPPVNRDPSTKQRVTPNMDNTPTIDDQSAFSKMLRPSPPLSTLYRTSQESLEALSEPTLSQDVVASRIPLYNGLTLLPSRPHRAAAHKFLSQLARIEQKFAAGTVKDAEAEEKKTFAYVFFSSADTVRRVDTVPLAIALWRVRMWEGEGWGTCDWLLDDDHA